MKAILYVLPGLLTSLMASAQPTALRLHPKNPHYFEYKGRPAIIVGSGEHYGAVINQAFDYRTYLQTLKVDGLNTTRLFTGAYFEVPGAFGIAKNTLAPSPDRLLLPWARSTTPGYALGGNKFDLSRWDEAYFTRLKDFLAEADRNGVIVEVNLFSSYYGAGWPHSPLNRSNNVNNVDSVAPKAVNTLGNGNLLAFQEQYVRKIVREVNRYDNLYFEIQNEPWADLSDTILVYNEYSHREDPKSGYIHGASLEVTAACSNDWQRRVAAWIADEERQLPKKHLIAQNISNFEYPIQNPDPNISIFNFHYANPAAVTVNYYIGKAIGLNETGFAGRRDHTYRRQAWRFLMAGGSLFNHLDYSFSVGSETGRDTSYRAPGGGSPTLRRQLGVVKAYFDGLDLATLKPDPALIQAAPGLSAQVLAHGASQWIIYLEPRALKPSPLRLNLKRGAYQVQWTDAVTGRSLKNETITVAGTGAHSLALPDGLTDWVLKLTKQ